MLTTSIYGASCFWGRSLICSICCLETSCLFLRRCHILQLWTANSVNPAMSLQWKTFILWALLSIRKISVVRRTRESLVLHWTGLQSSWISISAVFSPVWRWCIHTCLYHIPLDLSISSPLIYLFIVFYVFACLSARAIRAIHTSFYCSVAWCIRLKAVVVSLEKVFASLCYSESCIHPHDGEKEKSYFP